MLNLLSQILCWIRQFGALVLSALVDFLNLVLLGFVDAGNAVILAWPIAMPDSLPSAPQPLLEAFGWLRWSPVPIDAFLAITAFYVTVQTVWLFGVPVLRWLRVVD